MGVLFTCCAIILHNFLEMNMDIWEVSFNDDTDNTEEEDDDYMSRKLGRIYKNQCSSRLILHLYAFFCLNFWSRYITFTMPSNQLNPKSTFRPIAPRPQDPDVIAVVFFYSTRNSGAYYGSSTDAKVSKKNNG